MKLILKNHNEKYAVLIRKAPNLRKWCSTWENSISFAFGHFVKLLYTPGVDLPGYVCISMAVTSWTCKGIEHEQKKIWKGFLPPWCRNRIKLWSYHKKLWPCCWKSCGGWMSGGSLWLLSWNHGNKQFTKLRFRRRRSPHLDIGSSIPGNWKSDLDPGGKSPRPSPRLAR